MSIYPSGNFRQNHKRKDYKNKALKKSDSSYILLGMAYYHLHQLEKSINAFTHATDPASIKLNSHPARQWIRYLESEINRETALTIKYSKHIKQEKTYKPGNR